MKIRLKGINFRRKLLADGTVKTYYWAWKGGPRLIGKPGSPEFVASYQEAIKSKIDPQEDKIDFVLDKYLDSDKYETLSARTQRDYRRQIGAIRQKFGDFPIVGLGDPRARRIFKEWRASLGKRSPRQADYAWSVLGLVLSWALEEGFVKANPCRMGGRLYEGTRVERVWTKDDEDRFLRVASQPLRLAYLLAIWTGQRQGDLLKLLWTAYDGRTIRLVPSKSIRRGKSRKAVRLLIIPVSRELKTALDETPRKAAVILTNTRWSAMDRTRVSFLVAESLQEGRPQRSDFS